MMEYNRLRSPEGPLRRPSAERTSTPTARCVVQALRPNPAVNRTPRRQCSYRLRVAPIVSSLGACRGAGRRLLLR
jgi:hypothetical protein